MSENLGLGRIITTPQQRDAIHIAVVPAVAAFSMQPGERVGLDRGGKAAPCVLGHSYVGVVDPYLRESVPTGATFWLFLEPGSITSLRHDWTHPAFGAQAPAPVSHSEQWLRDYADTFELSYGGLLSAARRWIESGDYQTLSFDTPDEAWSQRKEFWHHYEVVTGEKVKASDKESSFFTCAC